MTSVRAIEELAEMKDTILLSQAEISQRLLSLGAWRCTAHTLQLRLSLPSMIESATLVVLAAAIAERLNHHPDIKLGHQLLEINIATHDSGGVTSLDFAFAAAFELRRH